MQSEADSQCVHLCSQVMFTQTYNIRDQTSTSHGLDGHLGRLGLLLSMNKWNVADMDLHEVVPSSSDPELRHGLDERHAFYVANSASKLNYADVWLLSSIVNRNLCDSLDPVFDCFDYMWNDLHRVSQIITSALFLNDVSIDLASGDVVFSSQGNVEVPLVVAQVEVDLTTVVKNKDFSVPCLVLVSCF